jgi:hypothetical protein
LVIERDCCSDHLSHDPVVCFFAPFPFLGDDLWVITSGLNELTGNAVTPKSYTIRVHRVLFNRKGDSL